MREGTFEVRLLVASHPEDFELAMRCVELLLADPGARIDAKDMGTVSRSELRERLDAASLRRRAVDGCRALRDAFGVKDMGSKITVPSPVRAYHLSRPSLARLREAGADSDEAFAERLWADMRRVQYGEAARGREDASLFFVTRKKGEGRDIPIAFWGHGPALVMPDAEVFLVASGAERAAPTLHVLQADLPHVAGPLFAGWLDAAAALLDAADDAAWAGMLARAREKDQGSGVFERLARVAPGERPPPATPKPWWRFW